MLLAISANCLSCLSVCFLSPFVCVFTAWSTMAWIVRWVFCLWYFYPTCSFSSLNWCPQLCLAMWAWLGLPYEIKIFFQRPDSAFCCISKNFHQNKSQISNIFLKSYHKANCKSVVKRCSIYWNSWDDSRAVQFAYNAKLPKIIFPLSLVSLAIFLSSFLSPQATRVNSPMGYPFIALRTGILPLSWSTSFSKIRTSDEELF